MQCTFQENFSLKWLRLRTFLDFFCLRLPTTENEPNNVCFEENEEDSDDDDDIQINFDKVVSTSTTNKKLLFVYQSSIMQRLQSYASSLILFDTINLTTTYALPLFFKVVKTNVNYQVRHRFIYPIKTYIHLNTFNLPYITVLVAKQALFPSSIQHYF